MATYNHKEIEKKWQAYWADNHTFKTGTTLINQIFMRWIFPLPIWSWSARRTSRRIHCD